MNSEIPFEDLPEEEQMRLAAEFEARLHESNERARLNNLALEEKVKRIEALAYEQEEIADEMEQLAERSRRLCAEVAELAT